MRIRSRGAALLALALVSSSCTDPGPLAPTPVIGPRLSVAAAAAGTAMPAVRISEIHYDNGGTDAGEAIEVSGPAGTDLTGWSLVLYNGSNGAVYNTRTLDGAIPASCGERGVVVAEYPVNGLQNGAPDGVALVDAGGSVVEFLAWEGELTTAAGVAAGMTAADIGAFENGSETPGGSLQRGADNTWTKVAVHGFGSCNDGTTTPETAAVSGLSVAPAAVTLAPSATRTLSALALDDEGQALADVYLTWRSSDVAVARVSAAGVVTAVAAGTAQVTVRAPNGLTATATVQVTAPPPPPPVDLPPTRFSEIHYDNVGTDVGEAIEVEGPAGSSLDGWSIVLYNGNGGAVYNTRALSGTFADQCDGRGAIAFNYPVNGIQNGDPDGMALVDAGGDVVEFLSYGGTLVAVGGPADGMTSTDIGATQGGGPAGQSLQRDASDVWTAGAHSLGMCNGSSEPPPPPAPSISFSGRTPFDPALPVGFQDQLFATLRDGDGAVVTTTFTWTTETPDVASIDADGVMTALAAGTATVRATALDGTTASYTLPTRVATASATALYANHVEFGAPADADPSDEVRVDYAQYAASFDPARGIPNWVSYNLETTHFGDEARCDCFTFDPNVPATSGRYTTADYTGAGAYHGYGIDRGHLVRSFDREAGSLDNANTYYFTNIVPQAADNNQGPWSAMEIALGNLARFEGRELFIIAGATGSRGTVKDEGLITIPEYVWKVAVVLPRDAGAGDVDDLGDLEVIAAIMPNVPGIRNVDWNGYRTTVDAVEQLSGYDLLALLPDGLELGAENGGTLVQQLVAGGALNRGQGKSLTAKLDAAALQLASGNTAAALGAYRAVLHALADLVSEGELTDAEAAPLRTVVTNTIALLAG